MKNVSIGFVPRERFSSAPESLNSILQHTDTSSKLFIVDCQTPVAIWRQIEDLIRGRDNVKIIRSDSHLLPNQARNAVVREADSEFL